MSGDLAVQYSDLHEWLLGRRVIPENYGQLLQGVDARIAEAQSESVQDETARRLIEEHRDSVNCFVAQEIYDALAKSPEGQAKSFLGAHTNPGVAKWKAVVDAYKRKNLRWANASRLIIQNVSYEVPALKKHVASCERQISDCSHRQADLVTAEANAKTRHADLLKELGISGVNSRRELWALARDELPKVHGEVAKVLVAQGSGLFEYYEAFTRSVLDAPGEELLPLLRAVSSGGADVLAEDVERRVPALKALREEAARHGPPPRSSPDAPGGVEAAPSGAAPAAESTGIDWGGASGGGDSGSAGAGGGINWDFEISVESGVESAGAAGGDSGGIDWGVEVSGGAAAGGGIDWGAVSLEGLEIQAEDAGAAEDAQGAKLLDDASARELLYQEVGELDAFLQTRCAELAGGATEVPGPECVQKSLSEVKAMAEATAQVDELLTGKATQRLLLLRSSDRYLDQHVKRIELAKSLCSKPVTRRAALEKTKVEQGEEAKRTRAEIDKLRVVTHKYQKELEKELSAHFRTNIRIVGDIAQI